MKKTIVYFVIATILLGIVVLNILLWVYTTLNDTLTLKQIKAAYYSKLPNILAHGHRAAIFNTVILLIAGALYFKCIQLRYLLKVSKTLLYFTLLLVFWMLFSMM